MILCAASCDPSETPTSTRATSRPTARKAAISAIVLTANLPRQDAAESITPQVSLPNPDLRFLFPIDKARRPVAPLFTMAKGNPSRERLPKGKVFWQVVIDKDLHRQFKARCVEIGKTMSEQAEELIHTWVRKKK